MKRVKKITAVVLLGASALYAGGDIAPVQEEIVAIPPVIVVAPSPLYVGIGYSCLQTAFSQADIDSRAMSSLSATAGYKFNPYLAIEGRYTASMGDVTVDTRGVEIDVDSIDMSNIGVYLKPQYNINNFSVYALLGYGQVTIDDGISLSDSGIQYGVGLNSMIADNVSIFVDYRRLYDDSSFDGIEDDTVANSYTVGINYHF